VRRKKTTCSVYRGVFTLNPPGRKGSMSVVGIFRQLTCYASERVCSTKGMRQQRARSRRVCFARRNYTHKVQPQT
jgi:hypothetical protein